MGLDAIRDKSRSTIHGAFALSASAYPPHGGEAVLGLHVRLHRDLKKPFGDLDREGFSMVIEYWNQAIFDKTEWDPQRNWTIDFGRGRLFIIKEIIDESQERFVKCNITQSEGASGGL
jgi:hypothetical protein